MNDLVFVLLMLAAVALAVLAVLMPLWVWLIYRALFRIEKLLAEAIRGKSAPIVAESKPAPFKQLISPPPSRPRP
jgi:hypothetical protein